MRRYGGHAAVRGVLGREVRGVRGVLRRGVRGVRGVLEQIWFGFSSFSLIVL